MEEKGGESRRTIRKEAVVHGDRSEIGPRIFQLRFSNGNTRDDYFIFAFANGYKSGSFFMKSNSIFPLFLDPMNKTSEVIFFKRHQIKPRRFLKGRRKKHRQIDDNSYGASRMLSGERYVFTVCQNTKPSVE